MVITYIKANSIDLYMLLLLASQIAYKAFSKTTVQYRYTLGIHVYKIQYLSAINWVRLGKRIFLWHYRWHPVGILLLKFGNK